MICQEGEGPQPTSTNNDLEELVADDVITDETVQELLKDMPDLTTNQSSSSTIEEQKSGDASQPPTSQSQQNQPLSDPNQHDEISGYIHNLTPVI